MKKSNISLSVKNLITKFDLYKKEQAVIIAVLLCFAVSGIILPSVKDTLEAEQPDENIQVSTNVTESDSDKQDDKQAKKTSDKNNTAASDNRGSLPNKDVTQPDSSSSKTWVPPVYKTVHHEAVYETRRIVICNYCGANFNTTSEFQIHKEANGG